MSWPNVADLVALWMASAYATVPLFWLMMHPFMERWRKRGRRAYWVVLPLWTAFIIALFIVLARFRFMHLYRSGLAWIPGVGLLLLGLLILRWSRQNFVLAQVSGLAELEPERHRQELIVSGIRGRIRHPIYLGHLCEMLGWCIGSGLVVAFVLLPLAIILGAVMIRSEDRELEARFGKPYRQYRRQVPAILPRLTK